MLAGANAQAAEMVAAKTAAPMNDKSRHGGQTTDANPPGSNTGEIKALQLVYLYKQTNFAEKRLFWLENAVFLLVFRFGIKIL